MKNQDFKLIDGHKHIRHHSDIFSETEVVKKAQNFFDFMNTRRSIREFSDKNIPIEVIENIVKTASSAPSGAHKQPWTFCVIQNPEMKKKIRIAAEEEEKISYEGRMSETWLKDLKKFGTNHLKPFLETVPYLIVVFKKPYDLDENGNKSQNYYVPESVGIACGILITAIHQAGLVTLTHTPSPMKFLTELLERPSNERPFLLLPVGYPADEIFVPAIERKTLDEMAVFYS